MHRTLSSFLAFGLPFLLGYGVLPLPHFINEMAAGLGLGLLLGGAIGNGIDRFRLGQVVDFLELVPIRFPIFNIADVAINLAVACLVLDWWRQHGAPRR